MHGANFWPELLALLCSHTHSEMASSLSIISLWELPSTQNVKRPSPKAQTSHLHEYVKGKLVFKQVEVLVEAFLWPVTSRFSQQSSRQENQRKACSGEPTMIRTRWRTSPPGLRISRNGLRRQETISLVLNYHIEIKLLFR